MKIRKENTFTEKLKIQIITHLYVCIYIPIHFIYILYYIGRQNT